MSLRLILGVAAIAACGGHFWNVPDPAPIVLPPPPESVRDIRTIQLARHGCLGPCPVYTVRLQADGVATYRGEYSVPFLGLYAAALDSSAFQRLGAHLLEDGFFQIQEDNPVAIDAPSVTIMVTYMRDSLVTRTIGGSDHMVPGLRRAASQIDSLAAHLHWVYTGPVSR